MTPEWSEGKRADQKKVDGVAVRLEWNGALTDRGIRHDDHHVGVGGEVVDKR